MENKKYPTIGGHDLTDTIENCTFKEKAEMPNNKKNTSTVSSLLARDYYF